MRWVEMRHPKNMQSDARKAHMRSFLLGMPVVVLGSWWWSMVPAAALLLMERGPFPGRSMRRVGVVLDAAVLVQVDVVSVVALERPEDYRDEHDRRAHDARGHLGAPEAGVMRRVRRVDDRDADRRDQDAEAGEERVDRLEGHVDPAVRVLGLR